MMQVHNALQDLADGPRMLFRSAHIYTLLMATVHLGLAAIGPIWRPLYWPMILASGLCIIGLLLVSYGFFVESFVTDLNRPLLKMGLFAVFGATVLLAANAISHNLGLGKTGGNNP
ncbi:hypothetical protein [Pseudoteredinibacter isoporae]|uniref:CHASE2 domain-containing sensor protein n=1 Tax=Pseudoteredinibacter isoporae TaxID=570281 RepID=A0A7X0JRL0_9GAMM|nr:hypothetical protein [Pseudoteredinibacter isoporae]MBB6520484.1 CHASE2 domain-containing sensor protein [Pseudoteredinibacter isoporae]NHO86051.1 hypothetical protein [Pseudoteredinibacter isoporae]NIB25498.1 hypothetical protein [Pseudoteredinibacter isoporae]